MTPALMNEPTRSELASAHERETVCRAGHLQVGDVDAGLHGDRVFAHQRFSARTFAMLDRADDVMVLAMRVMEHVVHIFESALVERERLGAGERHAIVTFERGSE